MMGLMLLALGGGRFSTVSCDSSLPCFRQTLTFISLDFEWGSGQSTRFGLQHVNYTDLTRTPKASMFTFVNWFKQHGAGVEEEHEDSTYSMAR
jgi:hypothetical protein